MHTSTSDNGARLDIPGLEDACGLLGGKHAWLTRHTGDSCQLVNVFGSAMEIDSSLHALLMHSAQNSHERPVVVMSWREDSIMCASLSTQREADGCTYILSMLFDGRFELTSSLAGFVDGLRCSIQALISWQLSKQKLETIQASCMQPLSCACCQRIRSSENGWLQWDDLRYPQSGRGTSHTYCEECTLAIYGKVL